MDEMAVFSRLGEEARALGVQEEALSARIGAAHELLGQIRATGFFRKSTTVGELVLLRQMKESKLYKGLRVSVMEDGKKISRRIGTFDEFCRLILGTSSNKVDEDLQNLHVLGEEFYSATQKMGLSYRQLRAFRALPEEEREEAKRLSDDPAALSELLEEKILEKQRLKKELEESRTLCATREQLLAESDRKLRRAREDLANSSGLSPDERVLARAAQEREALDELQTLGLELLALWASYHAKARAVFDARSAGPATHELLSAITSALWAKMADELAQTGIRV